MARGGRDVFGVKVDRVGSLADVPLRPADSLARVARWAVTVVDCSLEGGWRRCLTVRL